MANEVLCKPGTAITWKETGGTNVITLNNLGFGAGRAGAQYDKGTGAQEVWFNVDFVVQFNTPPVALETVSLYLLSHDGTNVPAGVGVADAAVTVANKLNNLHCPLIIVSAESAASATSFEANGLAFLPMRYISPVVWNSSAGDNLIATNNINVITLTPFVDELQ